jgi:hypothetical protein
MYELTQIDRDLREQSGKSRKLNVIPVEHPSSGIGMTGGLKPYLEHWEKTSSVPTRIPDGDTLPESARAAIRQWSRDISADRNYNIVWGGRDEDKEKALMEIWHRLQRLASKEAGADQGRPATRRLDPGLSNAPHG